jgi:transposase
MKTITTRNRKELERRRVQAGVLFDKGVTQVYISKKFDVSRAAVCQWHQMWKKNKKKGLLSKGAPGFDSKLTQKKKKKLRAIILKGPLASGYQTDFWTVDRIRDITRKKLKINLGYTRIWNTIIGLGFSPQKPERVAIEQNKKAITTWKLKTFPRLKKMG